MDKYLTCLDAPQVPPYDPTTIAAELTRQLAQFLFPLLIELDHLLDKRGWSQRWVWDARRARWVISTGLVLALAHPDHPEQPLSLLVCRSQGRSFSLVFAHC